MKITKQMLMKIIKEELEAVNDPFLSEAPKLGGTIVDKPSSGAGPRNIGGTIVGEPSGKPYRGKLGPTIVDEPSSGRKREISDDQLKNKIADMDKKIKYLYDRMQKIAGIVAELMDAELERS